MISSSIDNVHVQISDSKVKDPKTALFIMINSYKNHQDHSLLLRPINFVSNLSSHQTRPKFLIILSEVAENHSYEKLLRFMWSNDFLDATVLTLSTTKYEKHHILINHEEFQVRIHYFNPHTDATIIEKYEPRIQWFSDKVSDLKGYKSREAYRDNPPFVIVNHASSGREIITGSASLKMNVMSKSITFKIIVKNMSMWGFIDRKNKFNSTGIHRSMIFKEVEFLSSEFGRFSECDETFFE